MANVVLSFGGKEIRSYELTKPATVVGRDQSVDIVIDNLGVSRSHCQILLRGNAFLVQDMNSSNGTFVNGSRVGEHYLNNDDQIVVGKYALTFKNDQQAVAAAAEKIVPDSLNTYMMDGQKIKERLEEMRREQQAKSASVPGAAEEPARAPAAEAQPAAVPVPPPPPPSGAGDTPGRVERHTRIIMGGTRPRELSAETVKRYLYLSLVMNIVLIAAFGILFYFYLEHLS